MAVDLDSRPATVGEVLRGWREEAGFRTWFNGLLAGVPFDAFRWETPAVTTDTLGRPFECAVLDAPGLARTPDPQAFAEHFAGADADVAAVPNLGGDAILIIPCPIADRSAYRHLAAFVRQAPEKQRDALWRLVGETLARRIGTRPVWLGTAGAGVSWLHVRLDDRPKYYGFAPYRRDGASEPSRLSTPDREAGLPGRFRLTVDGNDVELRSLQMHAHAKSEPHQHRYVLVITREGLARVIEDEFEARGEIELSVMQTASLFNTLRAWIPPEMKGGPLKYWAYTVERLVVTGDEVEIAGECAPHGG